MKQKKEKMGIREKLSTLACSYILSIAIIYRAVRAQHEKDKKRKRFWRKTNK
jgi:hypothetical protein